MSPSPAISLDVSTMITRLWALSASTRATSRNIVVLPDARPSQYSSVLRPDSTWSSMTLMVPNTLPGPPCR